MTIGISLKKMLGYRRLKNHPFLIGILHEKPSIMGPNCMETGETTWCGHQWLQNHREGDELSFMIVLGKCWSLKFLVARRC